MARIPVPQQNVAPNAVFQGPQNVRRASASDFSSGGEGMAALGKSLQSVGSDIASTAVYLREKQEKEDKFNVQVQSAQEFADWTQKLDQEKRDAPLGAPEFTESVIKQFDAETQKKLDESTLSTEAKRQYQLQRNSTRQSILQTSIAFENQSKGTKARVDTEGTLTNLSQVAASDPNAYTKTQTDWNATVETLPLDANTKAAIKAEGEKTLRLAAARGEAERNPAAVKSALQGALGISAGGPTNGVGEGRINHVYLGDLETSAAGRPSPKSMYAHLISQGATPKEALLLTGAAASESGFNSDVSHDGGIGFGLFGHNNERLVAMRKFAGTDRPTWQQQAAFGLQELRQRPEGARVASAKTAEDLAAVQMAFEAPRGYTAATPNAGHNYTGRLNTIRRFMALDGTVGIDATSPEQAQAAATAGGGKTGSAILDSMSTQERLSILGLAETALNRAQATERTVLEPRVQDATTAYLTTGEYTGPSVNKGDFLRAYDPPQAEQKWKEFEQTRQIGEQVALFKTLPDAQIDASVASARPTGTGEGFAVSQARYEAMQKASATIKKQREADPASYVLQTFPAARAAWGAVNNAQGDERRAATRSAIAAMDAAYDKLAIPVGKRDLLPKTTVDNAIATYQDETQPLDARTDAVKGLLAAVPDPATKKRVFDQMVRSDSKLAKTEAAFDAWLRGDQGAATRLFRAAAEGGAEKLAGKLPVKDSEVKQAIVDDVMSSGKIGDAVYGLTAGIVGNEERARRDISLMEDAVGYELLRNGGDVSKAVSQAKKDIYGPVQVVSGSTVSATIPERADPAAFRRGVESVRPRFKAVLDSFVPAEPPGLDAKQKEQFRIQQADARRYADTVYSRGVVRNVDGGYALVNPETGQAVADKGGRKLVLSYDDILAAGSAFDPAAEYSGAVIP
jgi:hypothetical protein